MEGLVRLLVRAQLVRKDPLAKGKIEGVLANGREEESWVEGIIEDITPINTIEQEQELGPLADGAFEDTASKKKKKSSLRELGFEVPAGAPDAAPASVRRRSSAVVEVDAKKQKQFRPYKLYTVRLSQGRLLQTKSVVPFGTGGGGALLRNAARNGHHLLVDKLLKAGVYVNEADTRAETALHFAARGVDACHAKVCRLLMKAGADGFQCSRSGHRPYDHAVTNNSSEVRLAIKPSKDDIELQECLEATDLPWLLRAAGESEKALLGALSPKYPTRGLKRQDTLASTVVANVGESKGESSQEPTAPNPQRGWASAADAALAQQKREAVAGEINQTGKHMVTALMVASARGYAMGVRQLLTMGADRSMQTAHGCTPLTIAARYGHLAVVVELLADLHLNDELAATRYVNLTETDSLTALHRAAQGGYVAVCEQLIVMRAAVDTQRSDTKRTALVMASRNGHSDVVNLLLQSGAQPEIVDKDGFNVLASAARYGQASVINRIGERLVNKPTSLAKIIEQTDMQGQSPLLVALRYGHDASAHALLQLGARVNVADDKGNTPLAMVCSRGHNTAIPVLLDAPNCELERANKDKLTPLMLCCLEGNEEAMDMLLAFKANPSTRGPEGKTALMLAAAAGHASLVRLLVTATKSASGLAKAPIIEEKDEKGRTALMHAAAAGIPSSIRALLQAGADRHVLDKSGQTALMTAFAEGHQAAMAEFYESGNVLGRERPPLLALHGIEGKGLQLDNLDGHVGVGAIGIDMGTGEFKVMALLQFSKVVMYELGSKKWSAIDPALKKVQQVVDQPVGDPLDRNKMGPAFAGVVAAIHEALEKAKAKVDGFARVTWTQCYLSVTDWFRELPSKPKARATAFLNAIELSTSAKLKELEMPIRLRWEVTSGFREAQFEWKAVEYAVRQCGLPPPTVIFGGGKGSVQVTGLDAFFSFSVPLSDGEDIIKNTSSRTEGIQQWKELLDKRLKLKDTLPKLLSQALERAQDEGAPPLRIVAISGLYYTSLAAGLVKKEEKTYRYLTASEVCDGLARMWEDEAATPENVAAAVRFNTLLRKLFAEEYLHQVEILIARDWELPARGGKTTTFRTTWTAGWWIDQLVEMFAGDISPNRFSGGSTRYAVYAADELLHERRVYESELRLLCRMPDPISGDLEDATAFESTIMLTADGGRYSLDVSVLEALRKVRDERKPLVIYDEGIKEVMSRNGRDGHARVTLPKLLKTFCLSDELRLVPLVIPVADLVQMMTENLRTRQSPFGRGDLLDEYLRHEHFCPANNVGVRYEMLKDALAQGQLLLIVVGMELATEEITEQLDAYILLALGSVAHVVILSRKDVMGHDAHARRFEGCSALFATTRTMRQHMHHRMSTINPAQLASAAAASPSTSLPASRRSSSFDAVSEEVLGSAAAPATAYPDLKPKNASEAAGSAEPVVPRLKPTKQPSLDQLLEGVRSLEQQPSEDQLSMLSKTRH